ncbi:37S ribosomal protein S9, mitochondrial [Mollisiaceae sp. DMI_Dod_QoI]|nr:37S ribosomal protein S9, mitochondrial [Helotiales sp. DMI_Dod_QoI]
MKKIAWLPATLRGGLQCAQCSRPTISNSFPRRRVLTAPKKHFATSEGLRASIAAPEIRFKDEDDGRGRGEEEPIFNARLVPSSASYFTAQPIFTDDLLSLQNLLQRYANLPVLKPGDAPRVAWRSLAEYRNMVGETVKAAKYSKIVEVLHRLNHIHPSLMPREVKEALNEYKRDVNPYQNTAKPGHVDGVGKALGVGRRKSSSARAWVVDGTGEVLVNGKTLTEAFGRIHDRESAIWALKCTNRVDKYNVWALVSGGGTTGQAEALTLAVGKALLAHEPALKPALRRAGCMTRDPKRVERKKPGHVKARKMPAWVKR